VLNAKLHTFCELLATHQIPDVVPHESRNTPTEQRR